MAKSVAALALNAHGPRATERVAQPQLGEAQMLRTLRPILAAGAILSSALLVAHDAQAQDFRLGLITPPGNVWTNHAQEFAALLAERSEGRMSVTVFPAGQLGNEAEMVQQLQTGALDFAFLTGAEISNRVPEFGTLLTPFLVSNAEQGAVIVRSDTAQSMLELLPDEMGVVGMGIALSSLRQMMFVNPINDVAGMSGLRMRITPLQVSRDFYRILGVSPTPMPLTDVFDALANGLVDAVDIELALLLQLRLYERARQVLITNHQIWPSVGVVSQRVYARLSDEDKELIATTMREVLERFTQYVVVDEGTALETLRATGIEVTEVGEDFFGDAVVQWMDRWADYANLIDQLRAEIANAE